MRDDSWEAELTPVTPALSSDFAAEVLAAAGHEKRRRRWRGASQLLLTVAAFALIAVVWEGKRPRLRAPAQAELKAADFAWLDVAGVAPIEASDVLPWDQSMEKPGDHLAPTEDARFVAEMSERF